MHNIPVLVVGSHQGYKSSTDLLQRERDHSSIC